MEGKGKLASERGVRRHIVQGDGDYKGRKERANHMILQIVGLVTMYIDYVAGDDKKGEGKEKPVV